MYQKTVLPNGLRIVTEKIPYVKSITIGFWVGVGSRNENEENQGITHFLEHLNFKGTNKYSAKEIAEIIDDFGGQMNAFTGKEYTCYYVKVLSEHLRTVFSLLYDMVFCSKFAKEDIEKEKQVVLEEIAMSEDTPDELAHDYHLADVWCENALGFNILGTKETVMSFNQERLKECHAKTYMPNNVVVAVAGNLEHREIVALSEELFGTLKKESVIEMPKKAEFNSGYRLYKRDTEQVHICLSTKGRKYGTEESYAFYIFNNIFGGSVSSRLFQSIREEKGLAYSVCSSQSSYKDCGLFSVYLATRAENVEKVISLLKQNVNEIKNSGITERELKRAKEHIKSSFLLGLESSGSRMSRLGKLEMMLGKHVPIEQSVNKIEKVTMNDIVVLSRTLFNTGEMHCTVLGNVLSEQDYLKDW